MHRVEYIQNHVCFFAYKYPIRYSKLLLIYDCCCQVSTQIFATLSFLIHSFVFTFIAAIHSPAFVRWLVLSCHVCVPLAGGKYLSKFINPDIIAFFLILSLNHGSKYMLFSFWNIYYIILLWFSTANTVKHMGKKSYRRNFMICKIFLLISSQTLAIWRYNDIYE